VKFDRKNLYTGTRKPEKCDLKRKKRNDKGKTLVKRVKICI
jgi:hypothetical protein